MLGGASRIKIIVNMRCLVILQFEMGLAVPLFGVSQQSCYKSSLLGASLTIPVSGGRLALGTWQGIYLAEHRDHAAGRRIVLTLQGE